MPDCFIIMPISTPADTIPAYGGDADHFKHVLEHLFTPAVEKAGFKAVPPVATGSDLIHASIIRQLEQTDLVLCDMSTLNANVFLEFGIRIALNKPVCIVKDEKPMNVPFDAGILNHQEYQSSMAAWILSEQVDKLATHITNSATNSAGQNSLWKYFGLSTRAELSHGKTSTDDKFELLRVEMQGLNRSVNSMLQEKGSRRFSSSYSITDDAELIHDLTVAAKGFGVEVYSGEVNRAGDVLLVTQGLVSRPALEHLKQYALGRGVKVSVLVDHSPSLKSPLNVSSNLVELPPGVQIKIAKEWPSVVQHARELGIPVLGVRFYNETDADVFVEGSGDEAIKAKLTELTQFAKEKGFKIAAGTGKV